MSFTDRGHTFSAFEAPPGKSTFDQWRRMYYVYLTALQSFIQSVSQSVSRSVNQTASLSDRQTVSQSVIVNSG